MSIISRREPPDEFEVVDLSGEMEVVPVVTTDRRWPVNREWSDPGRFFRDFPQCRNDTQRSEIGTVREFPAPFSRGGGYFPVLQRLDDGRLACVLRTGAPHVGSGGEVSITFSNDGGRTWSDYMVMVRGDIETHCDPRNPAFGQAANGDLVLAYGIQNSTDYKGAAIAGDGFTRMLVVRSADGGETWPESREIGFPEGVLVHPYGQMRRLSDGTLIFNARGYYPAEAYRRNPDLPSRMTYLYRSTDNGDTWSTPALVQAGKTETGFLPLEDEGHWVAYVRENGNPSEIAHSYDGGRTWTRWEPTLGGPAKTRTRRLPGSLAILPNGLVLATYGYRELPFGVRAIVSRDGGENFDLTREYVITDSFLYPDCGYPSTVSSEDGAIVTVAYTVRDLLHPDWGTCCIAYRYDQALFE